MKKIILIALMSFTALGYAQVGINTNNPDASAALDITSTTGGLLVPRMTEAQRDAITSAATGLMIYQTDGTVGFYYYNGSGCAEVAATSKTYSIHTFYAELGGYVIDINSDGTHGLVVAMQDQGAASSWYEINDFVSSAINHDTNGAKFKDWRVPTKRELNLMYLVYSNGNGASLNSNIYWSSTQYYSTNSWRQNFSNGRQYDGSKNSGLAVRAVRAF